jgi:tetratricopeptide (TPR) repeat protein
LGAGAFGRIYRAIDAEGRPAAVKVLDAKLAGQAEAAWQFASEYRRLARLAHPAFPRAYEEGRTPDGRPFYAMALVEGDPPAPGMPAARVREVLVAIADALAYMHGIGQVHGDLKPENVRLDADGRVFVLDVGLMSPVGARRAAIAGTLEYLAPEALRHLPVDPASDMYALGALGFELWTGRPPFVGSPAELIRAHLHALPPPVAAPDGDPDLAKLLGDLLRKAPAERSTAHGVLAALGEAVEASQLSQGVHGLQGGTMVGREAALSAWRDALGGGPRRLLAAGAAGMGKSRLLDEWRLVALQVGWAWVAASGTGGSDGPAAPLRALVAQALSKADRPPAPLLAAWVRGEVADELVDLEPAQRQVRIAEAVNMALTDAAGSLGGLAVGLDDYHLLDSASQALLGLLARMPAEGPLAWAITADASVPSLADHTVALDALPPPDIATWLGSRLAEDAPAGLADYLLKASQGVPMALDLLLDQLHASGLLRHETAGWRFDPDHHLGCRIDVSDQLHKLLVARLEGLGAEAWQVAHWAMLGFAAGDLPVSLLAEAANAPDAAFDELASQGILILSGGRARLATRAYADILAVQWPYTEPDAGSSRRAWLARRLIAETDAASLPIDRLVKAARLAAEGNDGTLAIDLLGEAGRRSLAQSAPREAYALLSDACRWADHVEATPATRLSLLLPKAEAGRLLDKLDDALGDYEQSAALAHRAHDDAAGARAWIGLAKCRQLKGDYPGALEALEAAKIVAVRAGDDAQHARALVAEARMRAFRGEAPAGIALCEAATTLARRSSDVAILAQALNLLGYLVVHEDLRRADEAVALLNEAIELSASIGDRVGVGLALDNMGNAHLALGDLAAAAEAFARYADNCRAIGAETELVAAQLNQAIVAAERGELDEALQLGRSVVARAEKAGRQFLVGAAKTAIGQALGRSGRDAEALATLDEALAIAHAIKNRLLEEHVRVYRLEARLAGRDLDAAAAEAEAACALNASSGNAEMAERLAALRGDLARQQGRSDDARAHLTPLLDSPNRLAAHRSHQLLAMLDTAAGALDAARAHAASALAIAEAWQAPWHREADMVLLAAATGRPAAPAAPAEAPIGLSAHALLAHMEDLAAAEDEAAISGIALTGAMAMAHADRGYVLAYEGGRLRRAVTSGLDYDAEVAGGFSQSIVEQVLFSQAPLYVTDASADAAWAQARSVMALQLKTVIALPLATPDCILGVLYMDRQAIDPILGASDLALLHAFATAAASAIARERARAEQALATAIASGLGAQLARQLPPDAARGEVLRAAIEATGAERGFWLVPDGEAWRPALGLDAAGREAPYGDVSRGLIASVATTGEPVGILDLSAAEGWQARASIQALGLRTVWCLPAGTADGALLYLDTTAMANDDPAQALSGLEALLRHAGPLLA